MNIIAAVDENFAIGYQNRLPWHCPKDLARFKKLTEGRCVVMGRHTWESLPSKPLRRRINIILTKTKGYSPQVPTDTVYDVRVIHQFEDVPGDAWIIGGRALYQLARPKAHTLYLTRVPGTHPADTYFPWYPESEGWVRRSCDGMFEKWQNTALF